jgi:uncharacterized protein YrzB (UPF0473 family)
MPDTRYWIVAVDREEEDGTYEAFATEIEADQARGIEATGEAATSEGGTPWDAVEQALKAMLPEPSEF